MVKGYWNGLPFFIKGLLLMNAQKTIQKNPFQVSLILGFLLALIQIIIGSIFVEESSDVSVYVVLLYGLSWACMLYSGWTLGTWLKRHYESKSSWSSAEKIGVCLQLISIPVLLVLSVIFFELLSALSGFQNGGQMNFMRGYLPIIWGCVILISAVLAYIGLKVYSTTSKALGEAHILWGCGLVLFRLSLSIG